VIFRVQYLKWDWMLFVFVKAEVDQIAKQEQAVKKCIGLPLGLISPAQSYCSVSFCLSLIFAACCIELDPLPLVLVYQTGGRRMGAGETARRRRRKRERDVGSQKRCQGLHRSSLPSHFLGCFLSIVLCVCLCLGLSNVLIRGLDWVIDGPDVTTLPSTSYI